MNQDTRTSARPKSYSDTARGIAKWVVEHKFVLRTVAEARRDASGADRLVALLADRDIRIAQAGWRFWEAVDAEDDDTVYAELFELLLPSELDEARFALIGEGIGLVPADDRDL